MQQLEFAATAGLTLTATRRPIGSYSGGMAADSVAGQAGTNRYVATFSANATAGAYRLDFYLSGVAIGSEVYDLTAADGLFQPVGEISVSAAVDETAIALDVYRRIAGSSVTLIEQPAAGQVHSVIKTLDYSQSFEYSAAADSTLVFTVRRCVNDTTAQLEADSDVGLITLLGAMALTATDADVERVSSTRVDVRIKAAALSQLAPGQYAAELRELSAAGDTLGGVEVAWSVRNSAGRRTA